MTERDNPWTCSNETLIIFFLQAIVIVRYSILETTEEDFVMLCAYYGGFNSWVLQHALSPLFQLRYVVQAAEKKKAEQSWRKDLITD